METSVSSFVDALSAEPTGTMFGAKVKKPALALPSSPNSFVTRKSKDRSRVSVLVLEKDKVCKANAKTSSGWAKLTGALSIISASVWEETVILAGRLAASIFNTSPVT